MRLSCFLCSEKCHCCETSRVRDFCLGHWSRDASFFSSFSFSFLTVGDYSWFNILLHIVCWDIQYYSIITLHLVAWPFYSYIHGSLLSSFIFSSLLPADSFFIEYYFHADMHLLAACETALHLTSIKGMGSGFDWLAGLPAFRLNHWRVQHPDSDPCRGC